MQDPYVGPLCDPSSFPDWKFATLDLEYDPGSQSVWMYYKAEGDPFYSLQTLTDMRTVIESVKGLFASEHKEPWGEIAAASVVATLPLVVLTILFQRSIVSGLTAGAVKE